MVLEELKYMNDCEREGYMGNCGTCNCHLFEMRECDRYVEIIENHCDNKDVISHMWDYLIVKNYEY